MNLSTQIFYGGQVDTHIKILTETQPQFVTNAFGDWHSVCRVEVSAETLDIHVHVTLVPSTDTVRRWIGLKRGSVQTTLVYERDRIAAEHDKQSSLVEAVAQHVQDTLAEHMKNCKPRRPRSVEL